MKRTHRVEIDVDVAHLFNSGKESKCVCCPRGKHRFGVDPTIVTCLPDIRSPYAHLRDISGIVNAFLAQHGRHGTRVRITLEEVG